jgi:hypothetical protein
MDDTYKRIVPMFPTAQYRSVFMQEVFELTYHGGGGFSYSEVWNMPVSHRKYNLKKINEYLEKVQAMREQAQNKVTEKTDMSKFKIPDHVKQASKDASYVTNAKTKK